MKLLLTRLSILIYSVKKYKPKTGEEAVGRVGTLAQLEELEQEINKFIAESSNNA